MILFFGYLNFNNFGDELLYDIAQDRLARNKESASLSKGNSIKEHFELILKANDIVCLGGLWQDQTSLLSIFYYCFWLIFAKLSGKKVHLLANSIGPLNNFLAKLMSVIVFKLASSISVRDKASSELLEDFAIKHIYSTDLAWLVNTNVNSESYKKKIDDSFFEDESKALIISLKNPGDISDIAAYLEVEMDASQNKIIFLSMQEDDETFLEAIAQTYFPQRKNYFLNANDFSSSEILKIFSEESYAIISNRFHALLLAFRAGIEIQAIYDPERDIKIEGLVEQVQSHKSKHLKKEAQKSISFCKAQLTA